MKYREHLRQFFGDEVSDDELDALAVHSVSTDIRRLKPAISQAVWDARQHSSVESNRLSSSRMDEARHLQAMYAIALEEYRELTKPRVPAVAVAGHDESDGGTDDDSDRTGEHR